MLLDNSVTPEDYFASDISTTTNSFTNSIPRNYREAILISVIKREIRNDKGSNSYTVSEQL